MVRESTMFEALPAPRRGMQAARRAHAHSLDAHCSARSEARPAPGSLPGRSRIQTLEPRRRRPNGGFGRLRFCRCKPVQDNKSRLTSKSPRAILRLPTCSVPRWIPGTGPHPRESWKTRHTVVDRILLPNHRPDRLRNFWDGGPGCWRYEGGPKTW
jgi:hypothetical protein